MKKFFKSDLFKLIGCVLVLVSLSIGFCFSLEMLESIVMHDVDCPCLYCAKFDEVFNVYAEERIVYVSGGITFGILFSMIFYCIFSYVEMFCQLINKIFGNKENPENKSKD